MKYPLCASKTVLVTGCSSGIGLATARLLREHGWLVAPTVRSGSPEPARKTADLDMLRAEGFDPVALDVTDFHRRCRQRSASPFQRPARCHR